MDTVWEDNDRWCRLARCGHVVSYTLKGNAFEAVKKGRLCKECARLPHNNGMYGKPNPFKGRQHTEETKKILSYKSRARPRSESEREQARINLAKVSNRRPVYEIWVEKYGVEEADERQKAFAAKQSILNKGKNNSMYGKPSPGGSGVGWKGWFGGRFFRSMRELSFMVRNPEYRGGESAYWTASYLSADGSERTTRPDFVCDEKKEVVECKPSKLHSSPTVLLKKRVMEELCLSRGYTYRIVDPPFLPKEEIFDLIEQGMVTFMEGYEEKVRRWYGNIDHS